MLKRSFGPDAVRISALGLGCSRIGSFNNPASLAESERLIEQALDLGINLLDTADIYGQGDSERAIGRVLRKRRDAAFVVTKVGQRFSAKMRLLRPFKPLLRPLLARSGAARAGITAHRSGAMASDFSPASVVRAIERSLGRLGTERLDAVLLHSPRAKQLVDPALAEALGSVRQQGKIRDFGVACDDLACLQAALAMPGVMVVEIPPDVLEAGRHSLLDAMAERGIAVLVREVIRFRGDLSPVAAVSAMARRMEVTSVIAGTASVSHLSELVRQMPATGIRENEPPTRKPTQGADRPSFGRRREA